MRHHGQRFVTLIGLALLGFVVALAVVQVGMGRADGLTVTPPAYHEEECDPEYGCGSDDYSQDYSSRDRERNKGRNRGAFSPGPFDRSPVDFSGSCFSLDCSGRDEGGNEGRRDRPARPASLFPPSPEAVRDFVLATIQAGIGLGRLFADATITFVSNLLVGIA